MKLSTLSELMVSYKALSLQEKALKVKIALLSSFTLKGLKESLFVQLHEQNIFSEIYTSGYNQYAQEIVNHKSRLYRFKPDIIFLFIDTQSLMGEDYFSPYTLSDKDRKKWVKSKFKELESFIDTLVSRSKAKVVVHNFSIPPYSPISILDNKQEFGFHEAMEKLNSLLRDRYKNSSQVFIFDYESFCSNIGKQRIIDSSMYYLGDIRVNFQVIPQLSFAYTGYIKPLASLIKKCIVLDLDNTLWGGVIGEDGLSGIKLGPTPQGRPYWEFQKHLLALYKRGVILAINSKNNLSDALEAIENHPYMVLKNEHFASVQINWNDKATNMRALAKEINIGLDSLVFFDDDNLNRELIRTEIPEVMVIEMPKNPANYSAALLELNEFNTFQLTDEDIKKGEMYAQQRKREAFAKSATNLDDFLKGLNIVVTLEPINEFTIPRIAQLTQKTNQFNLTTRRYMQEEIEMLASGGNALIAAIRVEDKFGDNGLTGVVIVRKAVDEWLIDSFLMSCRVIGRKIEDTLLSHIIAQAKLAGIPRVVGEYRATKKNDLVRNFYKSNNFELKSENDSAQQWVFSTDKNFPRPSFIKLIV